MRVATAAAVAVGGLAVALLPLWAPTPNGHPLSVLLRAGHLLGVALLCGVALAQLLVLVLLSRLSPAADKQEQEHRHRMVALCRPVGQVAMLLIVVSGLHFAVRDWPQFRGDKLFHALFDSKMVVALVAFFSVSVFGGRSKRLEWLRKKGSSLLVACLLAVLTAVLLSVCIKYHKDGVLMMPSHE